MSDTEVSLRVEGMTCTNCAAGISKTLTAAGFKNAHASFSDGEVTFSLLEGQKEESAVETIEKLGYSVVDDSEVTSKGMSSLEKKFLFSLAFSIPLFLHMFVPKDWILNNPIFQICLATPVFFLGAVHFGKSAWGSIRARMANMDVLIFTGSSAAFIYSLVGTVLNWNEPELHRYLFFETSAMIITLVLLGNVIEHRAVKKTSEQLGELTKLQSSVARIVMRLNGKEKIFETDPKTVKIGDELQINEGDAFPVDGMVVSGSIEVDESALTGESEWVLKESGDVVYSGTTSVKGNCRIEAIKEVKDSTLENIIKLVKRARTEQPKIQILGDKVSSVFVPVVMLIALVTFLVSTLLLNLGETESLMRAIAVLVISCPCAMGLATPTAVVAGVGKAAKNGILIKGGNTLESLANCQHVLFDKTGTLTTGNFKIDFVQNELGDRAFSLIKSLETSSSHPIARSIAKKLEESESEILLHIKEERGKGMFGKTESGETVFFGKDTKGKSDLVLKLNEQVVARVNISDEIKTGAIEMIKHLKNKGLKVTLISGDREEKVAEVARVLGIEKYESAMSPEEKLKYIEEQSQSQVIAMVGDGINDGPAMAKAQVGIAHGGATSLAVESARIVIMRSDDMMGIVDAFKLSEITYRTIKQNLFWAFFYNVTAIPIASIGLLNPMIAALSMAVSDVMVIGNSLRLKVRRFR